eukprot:TRINITY_DN2640_c0_g1_i1.p1 TRINITY_DN2640_c0_g1~~TRINITY_DN2640_c0_g1_i1.p1  ORF type:complete len:168 (+),score=33.21 TRINITY_DN2640_c0_g1_i1:405-908(+)
MPSNTLTFKKDISSEGIVEWMPIIQESKRVNLDFHGCNYLYDDDILSLQGYINSINLRYCDHITDNSMYICDGATKLYLSGCAITDESMEYFTQAKVIDFSYCENITGAEFGLLESVQVLHINGCPIAEDAVETLKSSKVRYISALYCDSISDSLKDVESDGVYVIS